MATTNLDKPSSSICDAVSFEGKDASLSDTNDLISFGILRYHGRFSVSSTSNCNNGSSGKSLSCVSCPPITNGGLQENRLLAKQQKRLLLLRHSAVCKDSNCKIKAKCTTGKRMLKHLSTCTNGKSCKTSNCYSSSVLLRHFIQCTDENCELCLPLRVTTRKLPERQRKRNIVDAQSMPTTQHKSNYQSPFKGGIGVKRAKLVSFASNDQLI
uniref:histone acetyltransferase n=1 Tax=Chaetoceros debilis TaxID=122233 RepID=A0A6S8TE29_9STRA|mmetsp:Transcript_14043/g.20427  ORF Transcript_14043/g.20427 Transcript_14043/m.20427 type:complete len:212 (-) Transcript_14043:98-733(-)|eukprot:CAMPEP_0194093258 /NCGR_PEP_ID=MMETSP0149-20130528/49831_1 /TAXON_ID=122233 /ORGANISM="Chaetoceros debilis, Strain MM31A-1" /LENGTH=211 /DNA_ID=CAMNT_0038778515 /DNA_START=81 /DNA_END=716 /DNA_ORIENTATION=-